MAMHQTNQALLAGPISEERYREKDSAWHQLIDSLFSLCCESGIGFHLPYWKLILKQNVSAMSIDNHLHVNGSACSRRFSASEMFSFYRNKTKIYF